MPGNTLSIAELEERLRPGAYSQAGFLGPAESFEAVVTQDRQILEKLGISHEQVAAALESVLRLVENQREELLKGNPQEYLKKGRDRIPDLYHPATLPHFVVGNLPPITSGYLVGDRLQVFIVHYRGMQECPWGCKYQDWSSLDFLILNRESGKYVTGPGLIVHLIREHSFFEGSETPFRVDPARVVEVLELTPLAGRE
jgi:hypothetical protein